MQRRSPILTIWTAASFKESASATSRQSCAAIKPFGFSRALEKLSLGVLQAPLTATAPRGLRVLDIGCGFGEFLSIFDSLGSRVIGTEIVPTLVELNRSRGFDVRQGELETLDFGTQQFDLILLRAVFYRLRDPKKALTIMARSLLADGGHISLVDACPRDAEGASYFFRKQFPQGQFYILERERYLAMVAERFGLRCVASCQIYGRPSAPLKSVRLLGNLAGLGQLLSANLLQTKPYVLAYLLAR